MPGMQAEATGVVPADPVLATLLGGALLAACAAAGAVALRLVGRLRAGLPALDPRQHPPATWGGADVSLVALAYVALLSTAGMLVGPRPELRWQLVADIVTKVGATLVGIGVLRSVGASWEAIGFARGRWRDDLRIAGGGLALSLAPLLGIAALLDRLVPYTHPVVTFLRESRDPVAIGLVVLAAVVVAPLAEEFFFRRVLQGWLERRLPEADGAAAIGLSALAFAAAHLGHGLAAVPLLLFGIVLGVIARATGALAPCVLLHALFNAVSVVLLLLTPSPPPGGGG